MDWKDIAGVVGKAAPILGTLIGGPAAPAIGAAISAIFGTENTPDAIHEAIAKDPEAALKLLQFQDENKVKLQGMLLAHADNVIAADTARVQADVADRDSARKREMEVKDKTPAGLAWLVVLASVALGAAVVTGYVTQAPALAGIVGTVVGYMFSEAKQVLAYYFGSSSGTARTTELLAKSTPAELP